VSQLTLPDVVGPDMRVLICGLNPSVYAARMGVHYGRPGNRFWPAALEAGLVTKDRDTHHALRVDHVGWTDLVRRATVAASELSTADYKTGAIRLAKTIRKYRPRVVCFVGLTGWRAVIDKGAVAGPQPLGFAGTAAYVMPNTSGLNAHATHADFVAHLRAVRAMGFPE
jgi:TDG/mug DNA glycosylase family protein